jgi:methionyl-tRNA formyltransferase
MRILFMGSAAFACPSLDALLAIPDCEVIAVVTQPDRPKGRSLALAACPVKSRLGNRSVTVLTPEKVNTSESLAEIRALRPDLIVVVAYGQILKPDLLGIPPMGCINVHASLLPKYRGAAPIHWAIARGEQVTGVTTMFVNERLDAGDILLQKELAIAEEDTAGSLHDKLAEMGAPLLTTTIDALRRGTCSRTPQNEADATLAPKLKKSDGRMDWGMRAVWLHNRVRAFNPWPGCTCEAPQGSGHWLKVLRTRVEPSRGRAGTIVDVDGCGPLVQSGEDALRLLEVQPEGRKPMTGGAFVAGHALHLGDPMG